MGSVVGLGLHFDLQAVRPGAGWQLPVESWQRWAVVAKNKIHVQHVTLIRGGLILDGLIKVECAECGHCDTPEYVIKPVA